MIMSASPEFIALCQSQVLLLSQALGATSTVVYLAERTADQLEPALVPVVTYPDTSDVYPEIDWQQAALLPAGAEDPDIEVNVASLSPMADQKDRDDGDAQAHSARMIAGRAEAVHQAADADTDLAADYQMVLPLAHEGVVLGVMVSTRESHPWQGDERQQVEQVAQSLALACVMDQRGQWLQQQFQQRQLTQSYQSETFHDLLHQFKNPLTALRTFGKLLMRRLEPEDKNRSVAEAIVRESERLQGLVRHFDDVVAVGDAQLQTSEETLSRGTLALPSATGSTADVQRAEGADPPTPGKGATGHPLAADIALKPVRLEEMLRSLLVSTEAVAQDRGIIVESFLPPQLPPVWVDEDAIQEVFSNLLDNALKYSPDSATVWLGAVMQQAEDTAYLGIAVGDTGPGIPAADQAHIFERHYRGVQSQGSIPGTGLGLAIAYELVRDMGGDIALFSPAAGSGLVPSEIAPTTSVGTVFVVWLRIVQGSDVA